MKTENNYLRLLFSNLNNLFSLDLQTYHMQPVEEQYFKEAINFFKEIDENVKAFSEKREIVSSNLISLYSIPNVISAYDKNKDIWDDFSSINQEKIALLIYETLDEYYNKKTLNENLKKALASFFRYLEDLYSENYSFEKSIYLDLNDNAFQLKYSYV